MLKRFALTFAAITVFAIPTTGAFAAPADPNVDGILPEQGCHAVYPYHTQALLCGRGKGGPDK